jgi:DNA-binding response OmpR family regulator
MKTERSSMGPASSLREPAGKNRQQDRNQLLSKHHISLRSTSTASNCKLNNSGIEDGSEQPCSGKQPADTSTENPSSNSSLGTVLFVSDDDYFRTTARAYLEHVGLAVRSCADAARVPELFFSKPAIDLLLVDVHAIGMTGLLLTAELTAFANDLPVIIISAPNGESNTSAAVASQGWKLLNKPVLLPELLEAIHAALERKSSPETWNKWNCTVANNNTVDVQSRRPAVSTQGRRTARQPSRLLVMQGTT